MSRISNEDSTGVGCQIIVYRLSKRKSFFGNDGARIKIFFYVI